MKVRTEEIIINDVPTTVAKVAYLESMDRFGITCALYLDKNKPGKDDPMLIFVPLTWLFLSVWNLYNRPEYDYATLTLDDGTKLELHVGFLKFLTTLKVEIGVEA